MNHQWEIAEQKYSFNSTENIKRNVRTDYKVFWWLFLSSLNLFQKKKRWLFLNSKSNYYSYQVINANCKFSDKKIKLSHNLIQNQPEVITVCILILFQNVQGLPHIYTSLLLNYILHYAASISWIILDLQLRFHHVHENICRIYGHH